MNVTLKWITPDAEKEILYIARVSSPNQESTSTGLIKYLITHRHWSPFEMANLCLEIETSRAISAQILRHRSFSFQEFSQRYATITGYEPNGVRRQDNQNRQNSIDDLPETVQSWYLAHKQAIESFANETYVKALEMGISKESARFLLPMSTSTKLYMNGTLRSWIHYITERTDKGAQLEHREIAEQIKKIFIEELPIISQALEWK